MMIVAHDLKLILTVREIRLIESAKSCSVQPRQKMTETAWKNHAWNRTPMTSFFTGK